MEWTCQLLLLVILPIAALPDAFWRSNSWCPYWECCDNFWISTDFAELSAKLNSKVYGQHLVNGPVLKHLKGHAADPRKALALSFHGPTGTGKNHVSKLIVESMFRKGLKSKYVKLIIATRDFPHYNVDHYMPNYKDKLRTIIENAVSACPKAVFIIDEIDKMPSGLVDVIKPYLDYHHSIGGVDYRKASFFFLSNVASRDIGEATAEYWIKGIEREKIPLKEMENIIQLVAFNIDNGLYQAAMISKALVTAYIPFLPLERKHIMKCITDELEHKGRRLGDDKLQEIADELTYFPEGIEVFSKTGCKRVSQKVDLVLYHWHNEL